MFARFRELFSSMPIEEVPEEERIRLASCVVLMEAATADNEFTDAERQHVVATLRECFALSEEEAHELIAASSDTRAQSYDLWKFTHQINETCSREEKIRFIEQVWRVIYADGTLNAHEDYLAHKLARLLNLTHRQLIDAKMKVLSERSN